MAEENTPTEAPDEAEGSPVWIKAQSGNVVEIPADLVWDFVDRQKHAGPFKTRAEAVKAKTPERFDAYKQS